MPIIRGLEGLREKFREAVSGLPSYRREEAWNYVRALEGRLVPVEVSSAPEGSQSTEAQN